VPFDNVGKAQNFAAKLLHRPKLWLLLAALNIIPLVNILALGYFARVAAELPQEPPPLRPLSRAFVLGLKVLATLLAYGILVIIIAVLVAVAALSATAPVAYEPLPIYDRPTELLIATAAIILAVALLAVLGVPIALIVVARRGVLAALNPINSWRVIRRASIGEYLAYLVVIASFGLLSLLPEKVVALFGLAGYVVALVALILVAPLIEAFLWYWGGLIVQSAETGRQASPSV